MKITKIRIENYRSCADVEFEPHGDLSVLIGPNGSGKTNVLSAVRLLPTLCRDRHSGIEREFEGASLCTIRTWFDVDGVLVTHVAKLNVVTNERNQDEIVTSKEYWTVPSAKGGRKRVRIPAWFIREVLRFESGEGVLPMPSYIIKRSPYYAVLHRDGIDQKTFELLGSVIKFVSEISYYSASQFTNPGSCPISFEVEQQDARRRVGISISGHKRLLYDLYQEHQKASPAYAEFLSLVGPEGIGLVEAIKFNEIVTSTSNYKVETGGRVMIREKKNILVVPQFVIGGNSLSPSQLSEGTFKTLALIFYIATDQGSLLMIEEPEVCVHQGLLSSIVELIETYSTEKQIFVSTHSDSVLDRVQVENVFSVHRSPSEGTQVTNISRKMGKSELAALRRYLAEEGSLGEYWKHGDLESV